jgi:hypothetical protein
MLGLESEAKVQTWLILLLILVEGVAASIPLSKRGKGQERMWWMVFLSKLFFLSVDVDGYVA